MYDSADDFDAEHLMPDRALAKIASFARKHDGVTAHVTRLGNVLLSDRDGSIRSVRTMRACVEWLGY